MPMDHNSSAESSLEAYVRQLGPDNAVWVNNQLKALALATKREIDERLASTSRKSDKS